jgi:hypothetical protein
MATTHVTKLIDDWKNALPAAETGCNCGNCKANRSFDGILETGRLTPAQTNFLINARDFIDQVSTVTENLRVDAVVARTGSENVRRNLHSNQRAWLAQLLEWINSESFGYVIDHWRRFSTGQVNAEEVEGFLDNIATLLYFCSSSSHHHNRNSRVFDISISRIIGDRLRQRTPAAAPAIGATPQETREGRIRITPVSTTNSSQNTIIVRSGLLEEANDSPNEILGQ